MEVFNFEFLYELQNGSIGAYMVYDCINEYEAKNKLKIELKDKPKKLSNILDCLVEIEQYEQ